MGGYIGRWMGEWVGRYVAELGSITCKCNRLQLQLL